MGRHKKSESQKEADKKGKSRMERYEKGKTLSKEEIQSLPEGTKIITCYQKIEPGEWEKVDCVCKAK
jgi:hypothetical protein